MDEQRIVELITRKIAKEATAEELGELSYLLTKYPDSVYYEALLEQVWELGQPPAEPDLDETFEKHKLKYKKELNFKRSIVFYKRPAVVLTVLSCILILIATQFIKNDILRSKEERVEIIAKKGIRKEFKLPDGTIVVLNSGSTILYDPDMTEREYREVGLIGEAYFKVAHDKLHPFIVRAGKVAVKVLGTEFNLRAYPDELESETTLIKGAVELTVNDQPDQKFILKPSEKIVLLEKAKKEGSAKVSFVASIETVSPVRVGENKYIEEISWTENKFVFQNESFEELIPKLERWYNVRIVLEDPKIRSYRFTGVFINENIIQALQAMQLIKSFNYKLNENEIKIY